MYVLKQQMHQIHVKDKNVLNHKEVYNGEKIIIPVFTSFLVLVSTQVIYTKTSSEREMDNFMTWLCL